MIRPSSPAISEISVGSPSPPPLSTVPLIPPLSSQVPQTSSTSCYALNMKRLRNNTANAFNTANFIFPSASQVLCPARRKSNAERIKSFSIADILGKGEKVFEAPASSTNRSTTPSPPIVSTEIPANVTVVGADIRRVSATSAVPPLGPASATACATVTATMPPLTNIPHANNSLIAENLTPHVMGPALVMLDLPGLSKVPISNNWDATRHIPFNSINSINAIGSPNGGPLTAAIHPFFPPALLHYEQQRLAWDYQRQLQEHFQTQAQLLRQMSMDPNIIPSEDGSERSHSSSGGASQCCSPEVNVVGGGDAVSNGISIDGDNDDDSDNNLDTHGRSRRRRKSCELHKCDKDFKNKSNNIDNIGKDLNDTPLDALFQLSTKNFDEDQDPATLNIFATRPNPKKKRKSRTAFTNHQIFELEKRFLYQKYLSPADRDEIAAALGLSNAQVITWFQNRRAKLKRDMEELKKDVESVKQLHDQSADITITSSNSNSIILNNSHSSSRSNSLRKFMVRHQQLMANFPICTQSGQSQQHQQQQRERQQQTQQKRRLDYTFQKIDYTPPPPTQSQSSAIKQKQSKATATATMTSISTTMTTTAPIVTEATTSAAASALAPAATAEVIFTTAQSTKQQQSQQQRHHYYYHQQQQQQQQRVSINYNNNNNNNSNNTINNNRNKQIDTIRKATAVEDKQNLKLLKIYTLIHYTNEENSMKNLMYTNVHFANSIHPWN